jgi:RNA polymerase primary sigma factor
VAPTDERRDRSTGHANGWNGQPNRSSRDAVRQRKLLRAARRGDRGARERLVVSHLGLVRRVASHYRGLGLPFDDLVQEGALGLLDAIGRYNPCRQADFEAFARFRVRRAIRNALTDQARLVRLPKQVVERRQALARTEATLRAVANGRAPTPAELAAATGLSLTAVLEAQTAAIAPVSLDELAAPGGLPLEAFVADTTAPDPEHETLSTETAQLVRDAVDRLSPRQREIVSRHFGLDREEAAIADVARDLHLSERRTRTIEQDAIRSLAHELRPAQTAPRAREATRRMDR